MALATDNFSATPISQTRMVRQPLAAFWSLIRFGLCTFGISLALSLLFKPWISLSWWKIFRRCVSIGAAISLWLSIRRFDKQPLHSFGFSSFRAGKRQILFGSLLGLTALGLLFMVWLTSGICHIEITSDRVRLWRTVLGFLPVAFLVSVLEELVFRGFILQRLLTISRPLAIIGSSALYAIVHLKTAPLAFETWRELSGLFILGGVLSLAYLVTNQLYLSIGLHALLAYGARVNKLLIEFQNPSLSWLVGTSRLINGLASWVVLLFISGVIMWWARLSGHRGRRRTICGAQFNNV